LRQVGPRDKAKIVGGYGKCGRTLCCSTFLGRLESISMDMVRDQGLESKGSSKLSGACGKLLCCLRYEVETYRFLRTSIPDIGSIVKLKKHVLSSSKDGQVVGFDVLNQRVKIITSEKEFMVLDAKDIDKIVKGVEKKSEPAAPLEEEKAETL
jgi:cell fate regulator YaaT (PSP1 superfamily)